MIGMSTLSVLLSVSASAVQLPRDSIESPALRALVRAAVRDPAAVPRFWTDVADAGAPLVEVIDGDSTTRLVTFVWRGADTLRSAAVITPHALIDIELARMSRIPATDVWYRSFRMQPDARMVYRFGPGDSLIPFAREPDLVARMAQWRLDPLNPETWTFADGSSASVLQLAGPNVQLAERPLRGTGTVQIDTVPGSGAWPAQPILVYTPPGDEPAAGNAPLTVLMDGDVYLRFMRVDSLLERLPGLSPQRMPVVVLVPVNGRSRTAQYDCNTGWSEYLAATLVPWVEERYGTSRNPRDRIVGGYSLGGLAAACAAVDHPDIFGNVLAQSGSFYRSPTPDEPEALVRRLAAGNRLPIRWSVSIGLLETGPIPSRDPSMLTASRHLRDVLIDRGYALQYEEFYGGHEHVAWQSLLPGALLFLLERPGTR